MTTDAALLIVTAGPDRGRSAPLIGVVHIGRGADNTFSLADPALSRRHCVVETTPGQVLIRDLASRNGVFVNGCPVSERELSDGDHIRIGDTALVVMLSSLIAHAEEMPSVSETTGIATMTASVAPERSSYLDSVASDTPSSRAEPRLRELISLSHALQSATQVASVHTLLLEHAVAALPGFDAAILGAGSTDEGLSTIAARSGNPEIVIHRELAARALGESVAVLAGNVSALAVPLRSNGEPRAVLCLTSAAARATVTEDDLQLVAAMGVVAGLAADRAAHIERLQSEATRLRNDWAIEHSMVGESAAMQQVLRFVARVAPTDATILLEGESGTGKELIAHAVHRNSKRKNGPFVAINCAALPEALLESELFGHERGAFTGAVAQQRGRLELADRGTVFLDEVGELAPALQAKLLRVLQDQIVERVGGRRGIKIDVRVVAATNVDIARAMAEGRFRRDLYYRLNVVALRVPPLRERRGDIPLLAAHFVQRHAARCARLVRGISPAARELLMGYEWPGNVRELSNALERAIVLGSSDLVMPDDLPEQLLDSVPDEARGFHGKVAAGKRQIIRDALERHDGNVAAAARELDLQPTYLHRLIRHLGIRA